MSDADEERGLLAVAHEAASAAAGELRERFGGRQRGVRAKSTATDLVSDADLAAEAAIRAVLADRRPEDSILAEEGGASGRGGLRWVVDPLDGTTNFLFGIPSFAVSIACEDAAGALVGVVLDPLRDECFAAARSGEVTLNGEPLRSKPRAQALDRALIGTGFAYEAELRARQAVVLCGLLPRVRDVRRMGSAALDLAWTACARYDAYYERGLKPWDRAAGQLIAARAGLELRELHASEKDSAGLVVAPRELMEELFEIVSRADGHGFGPV